MASGISGTPPDKKRTTPLAGGVEAKSKNISELDNTTTKPAPEGRIADDPIDDPDGMRYIKQAKVYVPLDRSHAYELHREKGHVNAYELAFDPVQDDPGKGRGHLLRTGGTRRAQYATDATIAAIKTIVAETADREARLEKARANNIKVRTAREEDRQEGDAEGPYDAYPYAIRDGVLAKAIVKSGANGSREIEWVDVCAMPPIIVSPVFCPETKKYKVLLQVGKTRGVYLRSDVFDNRRIVKTLADTGSNVSSDNAKDVVAYLTKLDARLCGLPAKTEVDRLGWDKPLGKFWPYDADEQHMLYDNPDDGGSLAGIADPLLEPAGKLADWAAFMLPRMRSNPALAATIAASFASPLLSIVRAQGFFYYLWGATGTGKSAALAAAASIWAAPSQNPDHGAAYMKTFADTTHYLVAIASRYRHLPLIIDDTQTRAAGGCRNMFTARRRALENLIYVIPYGRDNGGTNANHELAASREQNTFCLIGLAAGESPLVDDVSAGGAVRRLLELNDMPFSSPREAREMYAFLADHYGQAGRAYIKALQGMTAEQVRGLYDRICAWCEDRQPDHPQGRNIALLGCALVLATVSVFGLGQAEATTWAQDLCLYLMSKTGKDAHDQNRAAAQAVNDWYMSNDSHFYIRADDKKPEMWGWARWIGEDEVACILPTRLKGAIDEAGYDVKKTLSWLADQGAIEGAGEGRLTCVRKHGSRSQRVYVLNITRLNAILAGKDGSPAPGPDDDDDDDDEAYEEEDGHDYTAYEAESVISSAMAACRAAKDEATLSNLFMKYIPGAANAYKLPMPTYDVAAGWLSDGLTKWCLTADGHVTEADGLGDEGDGMIPAMSKEEYEEAVEEGAFEDADAGPLVKPPFGLPGDDGPAEAAGGGGSDQ